MNVLFIFCEGPHDVQFIRRVLIASREYEANNDPITQYIPPFAEYFSRCITTQNLDEYQIGEEQHSKIPSTTLKSLDKNTLIIFYKMGGDTTIEFTLEVLTELFQFIGPDSTLSLYGTQTGEHNYALLFFYDADAGGIVERRTTFSRDYSNFFEGLTDFPIESWQNRRGLPLGLFIFSGDNIEEGTLENTIIHLFSQSNRQMVEDSVSLLNRHSDHRIVTVAQRARKAKSTLTICGQSERGNAGASLSGIIKKCHLLDQAFTFDDDRTVWKRILIMVNGAFP